MLLSLWSHSWLSGILLQLVYRARMAVTQHPAAFAQKDFEKAISLHFNCQTELQVFVMNSHCCPTLLQPHVYECE